MFETPNGAGESRCCGADRRQVLRSLRCGRLSPLGFGQLFRVARSRTGIAEQSPVPETTGAHQPEPRPQPVAQEPDPHVKHDRQFHTFIGALGAIRTRDTRFRKPLRHYLDGANFSERVSQPAVMPLAVVGKC